MHRLFEAYRIKEEDTWRKFRLIAFETWRKGSKTNTSIEAYFPIGINKVEMTEDDLNEAWKKYGKRKMN